MSAPINMSMSVTRRLAHCIRRAILQEKFGIPTISQIRAKSVRGKAPPQAKQKDKWTPRYTKVKTQPTKQMSATELAEFMKRVPTDDVWLHSYYPPQQMSLQEAISKHREYAVPEMMDNEDGLIIFWAEVNMQKKKNSTKYMAELKKTMKLPHNYNDGKERNVVAFCKTVEEKEEAFSLGAAYAGGVEIIKDIQRGEISQEEFDHIVCTSEMLKEIAPIRKLIKSDNFPSKKAGSVGDDLAPMLDLYINGKSYKTGKLTDGKAALQCSIGRLNMPMEHIEENFTAIINSICQHQPTSLKGVVPFITSAIISCPPSSEKFLLKDELLHSEEDEEAADIEQEELKMAA